MNINSWTSDSIKQLLSSGSSSSSSSSSLSSIYDNLSELSSIQSGSYEKLAKKYYANESSSTSTKDTSNPIKKDTVTKKTEDSSSETKALTQIDQANEKLVSSASDLYKSKITSVEDTYDAVAEFVSNYNSTIKAASSSEVDGIASAAASMVNTNTSNSKLLSQVGITMDSKTYQLTLDQDTFKSANLGDVKSLFSGNGSYAYQMALSASKMDSAVDQEINKGDTYTSTGEYNSTDTVGDIYDSLI